MPIAESSSNAAVQAQPAKEQTEYRGGSRHVPWDELRPLLVELAEMNFTQSEIAARLGVSLVTIGKQFQRMGIKTVGAKNRAASKDSYKRALEQLAGERPTTGKSE